MNVPTPVLSLAIQPASRTDKEHLVHGLEDLATQDPTFHVHIDQQTGRVIIAGMGELHLEIIVGRLRSEFNVEATAGRPQVIYKETLAPLADGGSDVKRHDGQARKVRLEPIMRVEVVAPTEYAAGVARDLGSRRGQLQAQESRGGAQIIRATVPLAEMLGYATDLRLRTHGLGSWSMHLDRYEEMTDGPLGPDLPVREPHPRRPEGRTSAAALAEPE